MSNDANVNVSLNALSVFRPALLEKNVSCKTKLETQPKRNVPMMLQIHLRFRSQISQINAVIGERITSAMTFTDFAHAGGLEVN